MERHASEFPKASTRLSDSEGSFFNLKFCITILSFDTAEGTHSQGTQHASETTNLVHLDSRISYSLSPDLRASRSSGLRSADQGNSQWHRNEFRMDQSPFSNSFGR